jgi:hypothetical protein
MRNRLKIAIILYVSVAAAQSKKPDFSGIWKLSDFSGKSSEIDKIEQTASTFTITPTLNSASLIEPMIYPTDGSERTQMVGAFKVVRTGHWDGTRLVLESRRIEISREEGIVETVSLSEDGRIMKRSFHNKDGKVSDRENTFEKVSEAPAGAKKPGA